MARNEELSNRAQRGLILLACSLALVLAACDAEMNVSPTEPWYPGFTALGERSLQITGSLQAENGSIVEATILYDGLELPGARARCRAQAGCSELGLSATALTAAGVHTISFEVREQSAELVEYRAQGNVRVNREGLLYGGVNLALGPERAALRRGERVTFTIEFSDDL